MAQKRIKIVLAPDKFKGSLSGPEFCRLVERSLLKYVAHAEIVKLPLADGGDGTIEVLKYYLEGTRIAVEVHDPLGRLVKASYLYSEKNKTAFIEMAEASGICLLDKNEANPLATTTLGTGELIADALNRGAAQIMLGIGGSATNDAGMGMAKALGFRFFDKNNTELNGTGADLIRLNSIDSPGVHPRLSHVRFQVACDVRNPLFGPNGAAYVYALQKGATNKAVQELDKGLQHFNQVVKRQYHLDLQEIQGGGAAGGLGAGSVCFLRAQLCSGIDLIKQIANFNTQVKDADWVITGEGKLDAQTFSGKVIKGIMDSLTTAKLAVFCGKSDLNENQIKDLGIDYLSEISAYAKNETDSVQNAVSYLEKSSEHFIKTILL